MKSLVHSSHGTGAPRWLRILLVQGAVAVCAMAGPESGAPLPADLRAKLPPDYRAAADQWLHLDKKAAKTWPAMSASDLQHSVLIALASEPGAADFVLGRLPQEPAKIDVLVFKVMAYQPFWVTQADAVGRLRQLAAGTPDPDLMLSALDTARRLEIKQLRKTISDRIAAARLGGDAAALKTLAAADERWMLLERGASLPGYLRQPPPVFAVEPAGRPIRVIALGDFGTGSDGQRLVAASMVKMNAAKPADFGITFGDNFYPSGMVSPADPRWRDWWENLYGPMGIVFYPSLGNHEWYADDGAAAEITYRSPTWRLPAEYYTFTAGPVQFFSVDTTEISEAQAIWLDRAIAASTARWKVVYGHHPIFAPDASSMAAENMQYMKDRLWPVIRGRVDAYLCGHQHAMAHMEAQDGVHFFISGGGGAPLSKMYPKTPGLRMGDATFGFLTMDANATQMTIAVYDQDGKTLDSETVKK